MLVSTSSPSVPRYESLYREAALRKDHLRSAILNDFAKENRLRNGKKIGVVSEALARRRWWRGLKETWSTIVSVYPVMGRTSMYAEEGDPPDATYEEFSEVLRQVGFFYSLQLKKLNGPQDEEQLTDEFWAAINTRGDTFVSYRSFVRFLAQLVSGGHQPSEDELPRGEQDSNGMLFQSLKEFHSSVCERTDNVKKRNEKFKKKNEESLCFYEYQMEKERMRKMQIEDLQRKVLTERNAECVFKPTITQFEGGTPTRQRRAIKAMPGFIEKELQECTFKPAVGDAIERATSLKNSAAKVNCPITGFEDHKRRLAVKSKQFDEFQHQLRDEEEKKMKVTAKKSHTLTSAASPVLCTNSRPQSVRNRKALLRVEINLGPGRCGWITVHEGDDLKRKVKAFSDIHALDEPTRRRVEALLLKRVKEQNVDVLLLPKTKTTQTSPAGSLEEREEVKSTGGQTPEKSYAGKSEGHPFEHSTGIDLTIHTEGGRHQYTPSRGESHQSLSDIVDGYTDFENVFGNRGEGSIQQLSGDQTARAVSRTESHLGHEGAMPSRTVSRTESHFGTQAVEVPLPIAFDPFSVRDRSGYTNSLLDNSQSFSVPHDKSSALFIRPASSLGNTYGVAEEERSRHDTHHQFRRTSAPVMPSPRSRSSPEDREMTPVEVEVEVTSGKATPVVNQGSIPYPTYTTVPFEDGTRVQEESDELLRIDSSGVAQFGQGAFGVVSYGETAQSDLARTPPSHIPNWFNTDVTLVEGQAVLGSGGWAESPPSPSQSSLLRSIRDTNLRDSEMDDAIAMKDDASPTTAMQETQSRRSMSSRKSSMMTSSGSRTPDPDSESSYANALRVVKMQMGLENKDEELQPYPSDGDRKGDSNAVVYSEGDLVSNSSSLSQRAVNAEEQHNEQKRREARARDAEVYDEDAMFSDSGSGASSPQNRYSPRVIREDDLFSSISGTTARSIPYSNLRNIEDRLSNYSTSSYWTKNYQDAEEF